MHIFWEHSRVPNEDRRRQNVLARLIKEGGACCGPGVDPLHFRLTVWVVASSKVIAKIVAAENLQKLISEK